MRMIVVIARTELIRFASSLTASIALTALHEVRFKLVLCCGLATWVQRENGAIEVFLLCLILRSRSWTIVLVVLISPISLYFVLLSIASGGSVLIVIIVVSCWIHLDRLLTICEHLGALGLRVGDRYDVGSGGGWLLGVVVEPALALFFLYWAGPANVRVTISILTAILQLPLLCHDHLLRNNLMLIVNANQAFHDCRHWWIAFGSGYLLEWGGWRKLVILVHHVLVLLLLMHKSLTNLIFTVWWSFRSPPAALMLLRLLL